MNLKTTFIAFYLLLISQIVLSQTNEKNTEFKPYGKPIVRVFANYHTDFGNVTTTRIRRAYLGYKYNIAPEYKVNLTLDVLNITGLYRAYLKNAYLQYKKKKITWLIGIIPTKQFKIQEKIWGYRYIQKVFSDKYALNASADLGGSFQYDFNKKLSIDLIVQNGTGYKKIYATHTYRGGAGVSFKPTNSLILRAYYDISNKPNISKQNFAGFISYKMKDLFLIAGEYNYQTGFDFIENKNYGGYSIFARYFVSKKYELFARYDHVESTTLENENNPWFLANGEYLTGGLQYKPYKGIKFSLNYQGYYLPQATNDKYLSFMYFNVEFKIP
jgi:hypothetical protein